MREFGTVKCDVESCGRIALNRDLRHDVYLCNHHAYLVETGKMDITKIRGIR